MFKDSIIDLPGVDEFVSGQMCIPVGWWLTPKEVRYIIDRVVKYEACF